MQTNRLKNLLLASSGLKNLSELYVMQDAWRKKLRDPLSICTGYDAYIARISIQVVIPSSYLGVLLLGVRIIGSVV